jgi:ABC-type glycerol-3-phosphate transport system substrate-binding protein
MHPYKKILGLIIALAMIFLSACSAVQRQPATATPEATATVTPLPSPTATPRAIITPQAAIPAGVQLTLWHPWTGAQADWLETTTDAFNQTNQWGITVTLEMHGDDSVLMDDVAQAEENGALPNVVVVPADFLELWSQSGLPVLDLNTYIDSDEVGWTQVQTSSFLPIMWKSDLVGDRRLGLPAFRTGNYLFYNRTWAEKLGFKTEPQNIRDFQEQACAAGKANNSDSTTKNNGTGGWIYTTQGLPMLSWLKAFAGDDFTKDGTLHFQVDGTQAALEYLFDLYNNDCAWSGKESSPYQYFTDRYALFYSGDSQDILPQEKYNQDLKSEDQWTLLLIRPIKTGRWSSWTVIPMPSSARMTTRIWLPGFICAI